MVIQFVVGWFQQKFFKQVEKITPAKEGFKFEHEELKRLMNRLRNFETVEFRDLSGSLLSPETIHLRFGRDGGIDCVIRIVAPTEAGARNVAGRIRNILINGDY
ncbi:hypothetical protein [Nostoc sp. LEGE 12450]|uniref:hypothetical protein n=1 Tax=Nostoc sp. LEGE 12450 TaxID=1828643 RepID=UPI00187EFE3F|nr:hypothetical protein [Nostoc sp. LEGE 12450]MBE8987142.1 hypothetical protein [Nostoc sp. LEGE 12450]